MVKIITAETSTELEAKINEWIGKVKPIIRFINYTAEGAEFPYSVLVLYRGGEPEKQL